LEKPPDNVTLNEDEYRAFCDRLGKSNLTQQDRNLVIRIFQAMRWMNQQLELGRLSIRRLKRLIFGEKTESRKNVVGGTKTGGGADTEPTKCGTASEGTEGEAETKKDGSEESPPPKPNHGRRSHSQYPGAEKVLCTHPNLKAGQLCPDCKQGKLHASIENGTFIQFTGNPPITAKIFETEKLRCALCGKIFEAPLPDGVKAQKWDETAKTITALSRYGYGFPHYRLEKFQTDLGVPVSDSVAFELSNDVADCGHPVFRYLVETGAQGKLIHYDDMNIKILELIKENKTRDPSTERVGMFTTAMISLVENREIALFFTGRNHAGENIAKLLEKRIAGLDPPMLMSDGSSRNPPPKEFEAILLNCLTHGRRGFIDLMEAFPQEITYVIDTLALVYRNDAIAKEKAMTDEERLRFHQEESGPLMEELKHWCRDQMETKKVEPNGPLGKAIKYMEKRWDKLTLFLKLQGAPLSNDIVERMIKRCVLHRKNSLFFWTEHGAAVGDILMTLIHTTVRAKENPFHYLTELQRHRTKVNKDPKAWLPWTYKATLELLSSAHQEQI
jgi:transposase